MWYAVSWTSCATAGDAVATRKPKSHMGGSAADMAIVTSPRRRAASRNARTRAPSRGRRGRVAPDERRRTPAPPPRVRRGRRRVGRRCGTSAFSIDLARLEVGELLLVRVAEQFQERPGGARLLLVDLRHREADVDQDPVADPDFVRRVHEQPDVDVAPDAGHVGFRDVVDRIDDLHDLARDTEAHDYIILL